MKKFTKCCGSSHDRQNFQQILTIVPMKNPKNALLKNRDAVMVKSPMLSKPKSISATSLISAEMGEMKL